MTDYTLARPWAEGSIAIPRGPIVTDEAGNTTHYDLCFAVFAGYRPLFLDLTVPAHEPGEKLPLVVWVHGGGWLKGSHKRVAHELHRYQHLQAAVDAGFAVASIDYRKVMEVNTETQCLDLRGAVRWLRHYAAEFDLDPDRFAYWGESAGAHLAVLTTLRTDLDDAPKVGDFPDESEAVQAIVNWYGPADFTDYADYFDGVVAADGDTSPSPFPWMIKDSASTLDDISPALIVQPGRTVPPVLNIHGADDELVPPTHSEHLHAALTEAGYDSELIIVPGADHVFMGYDDVPTLIETSLDFLRRLL